MNKGYEFDNGKLYVANADGIKHMEYNDNSIEILENDIEFLENEKQSTLDEIDRRKIVPKKLKWLTAIEIVAGGIFGMTFFIHVINKLSNVLEIGMCSVVSGMILVNYACIVLEIIDNKKALRGLNNKYNYICKELEKAKEKLKVLNNNKTIEKINEYTEGEYISLDKKGNKYSVVSELLDIQKDIVYLPKKYKKYLKNGKLEKIIREIYEENGYSQELIDQSVNEQLNIVSDYFEEKGYSKKKTRNK